jgi:hypothetical protein
MARMTDEQIGAVAKIFRHIDNRRAETDGDPTSGDPTNGGHA